MNTRVSHVRNLCTSNTVQVAGAPAKGPTTGAVGGGPGWSFPPFSTPLSGTSSFGTHQNFLQPPSAAPLQQQHVCLSLFLPHPHIFFM